MKPNSLPPFASPLPYRRDIDGLRAIAVLLVVVFHTSPSSLRGGFVGVDIFFVMSGFLISGIIFKALERGDFSFWHFYARRIRRIFPALAVVLLFSLTFGWFVLLPNEFEQLGKHVTESAAFVINFVLWKEANYFDTSAAFKPLLHLWSLGVEEQFYLTYPLLVWYARKKKPSAIPVVLATGVIVSFAFNVALVKQHTVATFYLPSTRYWQLLAGGALACATVLGKQAFNLSRLISWSPAKFRQMLGDGKSLIGSNCISVVGVLLIIAALCVVNDERPYPGWWALLPTGGAFLIIAAGNKAYINSAILSHPYLVFIGLISYPLYLWHWMLLSFTRIIESGEASLTLRCAAVALSFFLAWLTYRLIENPIRTGADSRLKPIFLCVALAVIGAGGLVVFQSDGFPARFNYRSGLVRDVSAFDVGPFANCPRELSSSFPALGNCALAREGESTAVVWGDSHAQRIFVGLRNEDHVRNWLLAGNAGCPPTSSIEIQSNVKECEARNRNILDFIVQDTKIETVLLAFFGNYMATENFAADHRIENLGPAQVTMTTEKMEGRSKKDIFFFGLESSVTALRRAGKKVIISIDIPELPFLPKTCISRPFASSRNDCTFPKAAVDKRQRDLRVMLADIKRLHPEVRVFDPLDIFCNADTCSAIRDGMLLYYDSHHLSDRGSDELAISFLTFLDTSRK
jgi:peptidoglycan/LPS O-acetylase OafA/YrhL